MKAKSKAEELTGLNNHRTTVLPAVSELNLFSKYQFLLSENSFCVDDRRLLQQLSECKCAL